MTPRSAPRSTPREASRVRPGRPSGRDRGYASRAGTRGPGGCRRGRRRLRRPATAVQRTGRARGCGGEAAAVVARSDERQRVRPALQREEWAEWRERAQRPEPTRCRGQPAPVAAAVAASPGGAWARRVVAAGLLGAQRGASASRAWQRWGPTTRAQRDRAPAGVGAERSGTGSHRVRRAARRRHERRERHPAERVLLLHRAVPPEPPEPPVPPVRQGWPERSERPEPELPGAGTRGVHRGRSQHAHAARAARDGPGGSGAPRARRARGSGGRR